jgi:hypothetical protein
MTQEAAPSLDTATPSISADDIFRQMVQDPEGYLSGVMQRVAQQELHLLREEMAFQSAMAMARQKYPELASFEPYVVQEIMTVLQNETESVQLDWDRLIERGIKEIQGRVRKMAGEGVISTSPLAPTQAHVESATARKPQPVSPQFSRETIGRMSLDEFLKQEVAINEALKHNRIK